MLLYDLPAELAWKLHCHLGHSFGPEVLALRERGLEPHLFVAPDGPSWAVVLVGIDHSGVSRSCHTWAVSDADEAAMVVLLRIRVEIAIDSCRRSQAWAARALEAVTAGLPIPPKDRSRSLS